MVETIPVGRTTSAQFYCVLTPIGSRLRAPAPAFENFGERRVNHGTPPKARMLRKDSGLFVFGAQRCVAADRKIECDQRIWCGAASSLIAEPVCRRYSVVHRSKTLFNNQQSQNRPRVEIRGDTRGHSSIGRARRFQRRGCRFDACCPLHTVAPGQ